MTVSEHLTLFDLFHNELEPHKKRSTTRCVEAEWAYEDNAVVKGWIYGGGMRREQRSGRCVKRMEYIFIGKEDKSWMGNGRYGKGMLFFFKCREIERGPYDADQEGEYLWVCVWVNVGGGSGGRREEGTSGAALCIGGVEMVHDRDGSR
ncbi:uncharacterized protein MONOS_7008 [Monocercomonoides exilis]|uniref:uncharacterized protein n=1 Tax=Monocercomonoides exilis TaxID=2049356 RepID=UPI00355A83B9|nr:hypothetical protein MONOS_7008 [Monocercomonoides exilis]|eukprot:MONOS_7008.1-p1 / transcript=MONOS_7008.1 / gene=MONOS_7008 / organism=Monocercomonoides_exilis_PA203 / gene_product=unspecified product / transcript_product=unspecified product / location=Mono_scaffold00231:586-1369(-) / protein_length=149 / sequence_SO=supercontig / SO=protein_coding / is_pseudo=false